jgi:hypothetical protein
VLNLVRSGEGWTADDNRPVRFGPFTLRSVDWDGTVRVGCHEFSRDEIERFAVVLNQSGPIGAEAGPVESGPADPDRMPSGITDVFEALGV